jgi:wyosine [tRNA(Phe)-imidazoG37] synthetase (radical SAM superfamily)
MAATGVQYSYGPVPSRRLGRSLGINNIPAKVCSYSCIYCQVGRTTQLEVDRRLFYDTEEIIRDVRLRTAKAERAGERIDYLTYVPDGEPTLDANLGKAIALLKPLNVPIGVITNSSMIWREDVRAELQTADWVSFKIDAVTEAIWRRINRPHPALRLASILDGLLKFAERFTGKLVTETLLVSGLNDGEGCARATAGFLAELQPDVAYLAIPTRPPAEKWARRPDEAALNRTYQIFSQKTRRVEYLIGYEGDAFAYTGDIEKDLLSITAVHPMRKEAVEALLARARAPWEVVERLVAQGDLRETNYDGHCFYLRRFNFLQDREHL